MNDQPSFEELQERYATLAQRRSYQEADALLAQAGKRHPAHLALITFWRIGMLARHGALGTALELCDEARAAGYWYAEEELLQQADFEPLQTEAPFQKLVTYSAERQRRAESETELSLTLFAPAHLAEPAPLLIALHGEHDNVASFAPHWQSAADGEEGWLVAVPQSSQISWLSDHYVWDDMRLALGQLKEHYATLRQAYPIDPRRIVLAGFSQGGALALEAALRQTIPASGVMMVEPAVHDLLDEGWPAPGSAPAAVGLRAFVVSGATRNEDYEAADQLCARLQSQGVSCTVAAGTNTWHGFPREFPSLLRRGLDKLAP
jgi:predicted esterase